MFTVTVSGLSRRWQDSHDQQLDSPVAKHAAPALLHRNRAAFPGPRVGLRLIRQSRLAHVGRVDVVRISVHAARGSNQVGLLHWPAVQVAFAFETKIEPSAWLIVAMICSLASLPLTSQLVQLTLPVSIPAATDVVLGPLNAARAYDPGLPHRSHFALARSRANQNCPIATSTTPVETNAKRLLAYPHTETTWYSSKRDRRQSGSRCPVFTYVGYGLCRNPSHRHLLPDWTPQRVLIPAICFECRCIVQSTKIATRKRTYNLKMPKRGWR
ncbi:hypothetical protein GGR52DRAFT_491592 [Hypoxylon sp. FL1284]|nr:hypothetical protein GGR52DRAFT_491592 [Hypoxylon sp. FL1284]